MITIIAGLVCIAGIVLMRKMLHAKPLDDRLFIDNNEKRSRRHMIRGARIEYTDQSIEREISDWLYPKQE